MNNETVEQLAEAIRKNMQKRWSLDTSSELPLSRNQDSPPPLKATHNVPIKFNSVIKWELPIELCPSCMARLKGMQPSVQSAWTNIAKDSYAKKKPPKAPVIAKEAVAEEIEEV